MEAVHNWVPSTVCAEHSPVPGSQATSTNSGVTTRSLPLVRLLFADRSQLMDTMSPVSPLMAYSSMKRVLPTHTPFSSASKSGLSLSCTVWDHSCRGWSPLMSHPLRVLRHVFALWLVTTRTPFVAYATR